MIKGLYISALGMTTQMSKLDVVSNNIANVNTNAFKKDTVVTRSFTEELMHRLNDSTEVGKPTSRVGKLSQGLFIDDIYTNFENGSFKMTDAPLDVAISGSGFFVVSDTNANGEQVLRYTRDGAFTLDAEGTLRTKDGYAVMGENGPLVLPDGFVSIHNGGEVYVGDTFVDKLRLTDFEDTHTLRKHGSNLYNTTEGSTEKQFVGLLTQGALENSNINSVKEMVDIINVSRTYEANQRMVTIHDTILAKAVNEIGRK